jgi:hypothetical protein
MNQTNYDFGMLSIIEAPIIKYDSYRLEYLESPLNNSEFRNIDKEWYIVGEGLSKEPEYKEFINSDILVDFLDLGKKISDTRSLYGPETNYEYQKSYSNEIISLCKKYGLLMNDFNKFKKIYNYKEDQHFLQVQGFPIRLLKSELIHLYSNIYMKFYELMYEKENINPQSILRLTSSISPMFSGKQIGIKYKQSNNSFYLSITESSILGVAFFQMMVLMTNPNNDKRGIKPCIKCGNIFSFEHGGEKDCPECKMNQGRDRKRKLDETKRNMKNDFESGMSIKDLSDKYERDASQIKKWLKIKEV